MASVRAACHAGARPKSTPESTQAVSVKSSTGTLSRTSTSDGRRPGGITARIARIAAAARPTPSAPPTSASSTLSVSNCRTMVRPDAPSARRIASSRWRAVPRARSRLATLAQAISSTNPTAPSIIQSVALVSAFRKLLRNGSTLALQPVLDFGKFPGELRRRRSSCPHSPDRARRPASAAPSPAHCGSRD